MLIIQKKQIRAMEVLQPQTFRPKMVQHLANHFPRQAAMCGAEGLLLIVDDGIARLKDFGLKTRFEAATFIDLTVILGRGFDTDPLLPWARQIIEGQAPNAFTKVKQLRQAAIRFNEKTVVTGEIFPVASFEQIIEADYDDLEDRLKPLSKQEFLDYLNQLWPQKFELIGEADLASFLEAGAKKASQYKLGSVVGVYYYCILMFLLGHDFDHDLQCSWISDILLDPQYDDEYYKLCSLHFMTQKYFEAMLEVSFTENL